MLLRWVREQEKHTGLGIWAEDIHLLSPVDPPALRTLWDFLSVIFVCFQLQPDKSADGFWPVGAGGHRGTPIRACRLHRWYGPQGREGRDVAGHSFRTGKPCCHPSRTQAPSDVLLHPIPQAPAPQAGPARAKKNAPKQAKRIIIMAPRWLNARKISSRA